MIFKIVSREQTLKIIDKCALFFFIVLAFFLPISNAAIESSFGFIFLMFIARIIVKKPTAQDLKTFFQDKINLYLLLFYIAIGLSIFTSGSLLARSLKAWITKWGEGVLLFYFARIFLTKKEIKIILLIMVASAVLLGIDGIYQRITGFDFIRGNRLETTNYGDLAVTSAFGHYNGFAAFLGVLVSVTMGFLGQVRKLWQKSFLFLIFLLISANIILTLSRGAWIALLIVCSFLIIFYKSKENRLFFLLFLGIFTCLIFSIPMVRERFLTIIKSGGDADRFRIWKAAFMMFKESPLLGKGLGSFTYYSSRYMNIVPQYAHNCYLQIMAETGLLGLVSFIWFLSAIISRGYKKLKKNSDSLYFGLFFGFLVFLTHSFFDTQLYTIKLSILFWLLAAFVTIYPSQPGCQEES